MKWKLIKIPECYSTNSLLIKMLKNNEAEPGTVLITDHQSHGRGRFDRTWISPPGNLAFSLAVSIPKNIDKVYQLNLLAGLSMVKAIKNLYYLNIFLKWPNDVIINNKKLVGILSESVLEAKTIVIGIGVNLNSRTKDFPSELQPLLTTLCEQTNETVSKDILLNEFLKIFSDDMKLYLKEGFKAFNKQLYSLLAWKNQNIQVQESPNDIYSAMLLQIDDDGFLVVVTESGAIKKVVAADIRLFGSPS